MSGGVCRYQQHFLLHFAGIGMSGPTSEASEHELPSWAPNFDVGSLFLVPQNAPDARSAFRQMRKMFVYQVKSTQWVGEGMQAHAGVFTSLDDSKPYINEDFTLFIPGLSLQRVTKVGRFNQDAEARRKGISEPFVQYFSSCPWFETADGYIGRGPPYMTVGDMVCVVKDCGLPILLRRSADGYSHVGPCWVEGLLGGEAIDFVQDGRSSLEWFEIR
ncbi:hypothetical protein HD806DRAFT_492845 [Xylariaceae sp. AK1471]|nr:hypothetical protein HD806DRAFT_492845 [Xylariaceae sp. AK1471]